MKATIVKKPTWDREYNSNKHLDWDKLTDGKCYTLEYTPDSDEGFHTMPANFTQLLNNQARKRGLSVKVKHIDPTTVQFQFVPFGET